MPKVSLFDKRIIKESLEFTSVIGTILSLILIFVDIPSKMKLWLGGICFLILIVNYFRIWFRFNHLEEVDLDIEGSTVIVKVGDIFKQDGFKAIAFNEYFDTLVDDKIISRRSLNGMFVKRFFADSTRELDEHIEKYDFDDDEFLEENTLRKSAKSKKYRIGSICVYEDYLLTAFSKFDEQNKAWLTMPEYLSFLITFWDKVNKIYAQQSVSVPIFGSGITRIKEHRNISDEDLLKIMLWTFRISEMRFKYPAKLTIVVYEQKIDKINLLDIKSARNGL